MSRPKILVVRPDRLGDVMLSLPAIHAIKEVQPNSNLTFLVRSSIAPLLQELSFIDEFILFDEASFKFFHFVKELKSRQFDAVIFLTNHREIAIASFLAGIHDRVGPLSKIYSYFCFNKGLRQNRSGRSLHESEYGLELVGHYLGQTLMSEIKPTLAVSEDSRLLIDQYLNKLGLDRFVCIHPGMGGSALNWPIERYGSLVSQLKNEAIPVILTGGTADHDILTQLIKRLGEGDIPVFGFPEQRPLSELAALYERASCVVAPSTGPLHVAAAVGAPVIGIYPPIKVQSPSRWGPLGGRSQAIVPKVECPETFKCAGSHCEFFPCMSKIEETTIVSAVKEILKGPKREERKSNGQYRSQTQH